MLNRRRLKIKYIKFLSHKFWGDATDAAYSSGALPILIDERAKGKKHLEILLHEALHVINPLVEEEEIINAGVILANTLWAEGYRRIDNDQSEPLQDGKH